MFARLLATRAGFGIFWVRLPLAICMIMHGYGKITNLQGFIDACDSIGISPFFAVLGACGEFLGGLGVLFGLLSRIAGFGVACTMATAAVTRHFLPGYGYEMNWHGALPLGAEGYEFHTLAIGMGLCIMFVGAGSFSIDYYLARYLARDKKHRLTNEAVPVLATLILLLIGCSANPEKRVAREAAAAMTGSAWTLTVVGSITMEGTGTITDGAEPGAVKSFQRVLNLKRGGAWRQEETGDAGTVVHAVIGNTAFDIDGKGKASTLSDQDARDRHAEIYHDPIAFLEAAFARNAQIGNSRTEGNLDAVDLKVDGETYSLYIDRATKLPAKIVSKVRGGEATFETSFSQYVNVHGYTLPSHIVTKRNDAVMADLKIDRRVDSTDPVRLAVPAGIKIEQPI